MVDVDSACVCLPIYFLCQGDLGTVGIKTRHYCQAQSVGICGVFVSEFQSGKDSEIFCSMHAADNKTAANGVSDVDCKYIAAADTFSDRVNFQAALCRDFEEPPYLFAIIRIIQSINPMR